MSVGNKDIQRIMQISSRLEQVQRFDSNSEQEILATYFKEFMGIDDPESMSEAEGISKSAKAFTEISSHLVTLAQEIQKLQRQIKEKQPSSQNQAQSSGTLNFQQMSEANNKIIRIQAWWRKELCIKNLQNKIDEARAALTIRKEMESPEEGALREFAQQLQKKNVTSEGFFRICDIDYKQSVRVDAIKEQITKQGLQLSKGQISRLMMILDEDLEGHVTREEFYNALEAYNVSGEKHKSLDGSVYHPFEHRVLFRLILELQRKSINYYEMFNACDINDDSRVEINEIRKFVESLNQDFKIKEIHALMNYLDIDKNGLIDKDEFLRQLTKGEQTFKQSQVLAKQFAQQKASQRTQENNFFEEQQMDGGDQAFFGLFGGAKKEPEPVATKPQVQSKTAQQQNVVQQNQKTTASNQQNTNAAIQKPNQNLNSLTTDDQRRRGIIQKMESEGLNFQSFFATLKKTSKGGYLTLGGVLKNIEQSYPTIGPNDRNFLIKDCIVERNKIDYVKLEELFTRFSKNLQPSVSQTFSVIAQNVFKRMGGTPQESIRQFLRAQNLSETDSLSSIDFCNMFSKQFGANLTQNDLDAAFNSLNLDGDGFIDVRDLVEVLLSYISTDDKTAMSIRNLGSVIPNFDSMSPRTRCEQVILYIIQELNKKSLKPINVYKMADSKNVGQVQTILIEQSFAKILPLVKKEVFSEAMTAFKAGKDQMVSREDFELVFSEQQVQKTTSYVPNSSNLGTKKASQATLQQTPQKEQLSKDATFWVRKLDDIMLKEGLSPSVAFKAADLNHNNVITVDELREAIKKLLPDDLLSLSDLKNIMLALDTNKNGVLEEGEFIQAFEKARNATVVMMETPQKNSRIQNNNLVDDDRRKQLPLKDQVKQKGQSSQQQQLTDEATLRPIIQTLDRKVNLKKFFSDFVINEEGNILCTSIARKFKMEKLSDGKSLLPQDYKELIAYIDQAGNGLVSAKDLLSFLETYATQSFTTDFTLELKYIANVIEFQKRQSITKRFFEVNTQLKPNMRLMEVEVMSQLQTQFGISMKIGRLIYQALQEQANGKDVFLDALCKAIDDFRVVAPQVAPSKNQTSTTSSKQIDTNFLYIKFAIQYAGMISQMKDSFVQKLKECGKAGKMNIQDFFELAVNNMVFNEVEARQLFQDWCKNSKIPNAIDQETFTTTLNTLTDKIRYAQDQSIGQILLEKAADVLEGVSKLKMSDQGYLSKSALIQHFIQKQIIQRRGQNLQDSFYCNNLRSILSLPSDFKIPSQLQDSEYIEEALSTQSENCQLWALTDFFGRILEIQESCDELIFRVLGKIFDLLIPNKPSSAITQLVPLTNSDVTSHGLLTQFFQKIDGFSKQKIPAYDHGEFTNFTLKQIQKLYQKLGGKPIKVSIEDNVLYQKINRHRGLVPAMKGNEKNLMNDSINQRVVDQAPSSSSSSKNDVDLINKVELSLKMKLEVALDERILDEIIPSQQFQALLVKKSPSLDKQIAFQLIQRLDSMKSGRIEMLNLIQLLKGLPARYSKQEVIKKIADQCEDPVIQYLQKQGLNPSEYFGKEDFCNQVSELGLVSKFHCLCLFLDYADEEEAHQIELQQFVKDVAGAKQVKKPVTAVSQPQKQPVAEPAQVQKLPTKTTSLQNVVKPGGRKEKLIQKNIEVLGSILVGLRNACNDKNKNNLLLQFFESNKGKVLIDEFFDFIQDSLLVKGNQIQLDKLEDLLDVNNKGLVKIVDFVQFSQDYQVNFTPDITKYKTISPSLTVKGDLVQVCDTLSYTLSDKDYFQGCPTILNSEEAALAQAHRIFVYLKSTARFLDTHFGPKDEEGKDMIGNKMSLYFNGDPPTGYCKPEEISWLRPEQMSIPADKKPMFFEGDAGSNDVKQGQIGDCWFIGALSVIAIRDELLRGAVEKHTSDQVDKEVTDDCANDLSRGVYPPLFHMYRVRGMYILRFYKEFAWRYVIIDDRIPCYKGTREPVFGRCKNINELWVPLIEKAYAKLHGNYETLVSGFIDDALSDLSGLVAEKIRLHNDQGIFPHKSIGNADQFWDYLIKCKNNQCMMGCSVNGDTEREIMQDGFKTGIMTGHAYSILDVFELPHNNEIPNKKREFLRLLRIRNPWGKMEWKGKWSDQSDELQEYKQLFSNYKDDEGIVVDPFEEDGAFFINYSDFRSIYNNMFICIDFEHSWDGVRFSSSWTAQSSGGTPSPMTPDNQKKWAANPQYLCQIKNETGEIFISLGQPDGRLKQPDGSFLKFPYSQVIRQVCFTVCSLPPGMGKLETFDKNNIKQISILKAHREISMRLKLPKGKYVIVPSTRSAGEEGKFFLSIYHNCEQQQKIMRIDQQEDYDKIVEEKEDQTFPDWKYELISQRFKFMIGSDDHQMNESLLKSSQLLTGTMKVKDGNNVSFEEEKIGGGTQAFFQGDEFDPSQGKSSAFNVSEEAKEIVIEFMRVFPTLNSTIIQSGLNKVSIALKSFPDLETGIKIIDVNGTGSVKIDQLDERLQGIKGLSDHERLAASFIAMDSVGITSVNVEVKNYVQMMRLIKLNAQTVKQYQKILQSNYDILDGLTKSLMKKERAKQGLDERKKRRMQAKIRELRSIIVPLKEGLDNSQNNKELIGILTSKNGAISYTKFFDFLTQTLGIQEDEELFDKIGDEIDNKSTGKIKITDFSRFCEDYEINFKPVDLVKFQTKQIIRKGEKLTVGTLEYDIIPKEDYYRGIPTILNSEKAALVICHKIVSQLKEGVLYFDTDFGPKNEKDVNGNKLSLYFEGLPPKGYRNPDNVQWRRPSEFSDVRPQFIDDGASANDVKQGEIGDCWFIGALSVLATRDDLLRGGIGQLKNKGEDVEVDDELAQQLSKGVYQPIFHIYRKRGLYVFKFFKEFDWRYVIVDDRIPCGTNNGLPVFGTCSQIHELWVPLIEKAYAKLHGCYETLISGFIDDALTDLTGLVAEKIKIHDDKGIFPHKSLGDKLKFWEVLKSRIKENCMMGCSVSGDVERQIMIDGMPSGIMTGHAYGIIDVFELVNEEMGRTHKMIRIRNPWGKGEWKGKWADGSNELDNYRQILYDQYISGLSDDEKFEPGKEDGQFLMCYSDWRSIYNNIFVTVDFPDSWNGIRFNHQWNSSNSGGTPSPLTQENCDRWAKNPQFQFDNRKKCEVFVSLAQPDGRAKRSDGKYYKFPYVEVIHPVCFTVYQLEAGKYRADTFKKSQIRYVSIVKEHKEISLRFQLDVGRYVIVPSTRNAGEYGEFTLSIYFNIKEHQVEYKLIGDESIEAQIIKEESEHVNSVEAWKLQLLKDRLQYMVADEDEDQSMIKS